MKAKLFFILALCYFNKGFSQTGPGGVGSTDAASSLVFWLDANTITGLADGAAVTSWTDQSFYGNDAATSTTYACEQAPEYKISEQNGMPSVFFDANNYEIMEVAYDATMAPVNSLTIMGVFQPEACAGDGCRWGAIMMFENNDSWTDGYCFGCRDNRNEDWYFYADDFNEGLQPGDPGTAYTNGTPYIYGLTRSSADGDNYLWANDAEFVSSETSGGASTMDYNQTNAITIGGYTTNPCGGNNYNVEGYLPELIMFNEVLNDAQMVIVNNYLSAKYAISLANSDVYNEDDNGDYDFEVAGIGQAADGTNHTDAQGTGIIRINTPSGLGNDEFLMWGHDNADLLANNTLDIAAESVARLNRVWRVSEVNAAGVARNVGNIDMIFDLTNTSLVNISAADLQLIIDTDNDGVFTDETIAGGGVITGSTDNGDGTFEFAAVSAISNNLRFTLATSEVEDYTDYGKSIPITINTTSSGADVATTQTSFPLLLRITDCNKPSADFWGTETQDAGQDIRFSKTSDITQHFPYEIERWDNTNKLAEIWVLLDSVEGNTNSNYLTMHWENATAIDFSSPEAVFETTNDYEGVWHLNEETAGTGTANLYQDATTNSNDGDDEVSDTGTEGQIGLGQELDGTDDYIALPDATHDFSGVFTVSCWAKFSALGVSGNLVAKNQDINSFGFVLRKNAADMVSILIKNNGTQINSKSVSISSADQWYHLTATIDGSDSAIVYLDGVATAAAFMTERNDKGSLRIGELPDPFWNSINGNIDDVRISSSVRSADWIKLSYENQKTTQTLVQYEDYSNWGNSKLINLNTTSTGADVATTQTRFPLLISITDCNKPSGDFWGTETQDAGQDLRFSKTSDITHHFPYEIERWDNTNKLAEIWVLVDSVAGNTKSDYLTMHWGNSSVCSSSNAEAVFETTNGFAAVWHLDDDPTGSIFDATSNSNDGTSTGSMTSGDVVTGIVGEGTDFDGTDDNILKSLTASYWGEFSVSLWVKAGSLGQATNTSAFNNEGGSLDDFQVRINSDMYQISGRDASNENLGAVITTDWIYLTLNYDGTNSQGYYNGSQSFTFSGGDDNFGRIQAGVNRGQNRFFEGIIDELQVSDTTRSADWIKLCYENQKEDQLLVSSNIYAPGGSLANLTLWLKADAGVKNGGSAISSGTTDEWENSFTNCNFTKIDVAGGTPNLTAGFMNYNPSIYFDGVDDIFEEANIDADVFFADQDNTVFLVFRRVTTLGGKIFAGWESDASTDRLAYYESVANGTLRSDVFADASKALVGTSDIIEKNSIATTFSDASDRILFINGTNERQAVAGSMTVAGNTGDFAIGNINSGSSRFAESYISELIFYNTALSTTEINKVETYLAAKYGITLPGDYTASNDTVIWSTDATYQNDIIVIGRDDNEELLQKQSKTIDDSLKVYIDALVASNGANAGSISNDTSYLVIGHNAERQQGFEVEMPTGIESILEREWKITNTNFADSYSIEIEWDSNGVFDINDIRLLVDDDGNFSDATVLGTASGLTFSNGSIIISGITTAHIPINSTSYFTIGSVDASSASLPIELLSFEAEVQENSTVTLEWETATELNNDYFTIERIQDTVQWESVIQVQGAGNSTTRRSYSTVDDAPYAGLSYYRLKQTDFDGMFSYSPIKAVRVNSSNSVEIYPNPTQNKITVKGSKSELSQISVYDVIGQDVTSQTQQTRSGVSSLVIDLSRLPNGIYFLKTTSTANRVIKH